MTPNAQLSFDFAESATQRTRTAVKQRDQLALFPTFVPNLDISIHSESEAVVHVSASGDDLERARDWITGLSGTTRTLNRRRFIIPVKTLDRFAWARPPARITLDANAHAVASVIHAHKLGYKPMRVYKNRRPIGTSPRGWPADMKIRDIGWPAILSIMHLNIPVDIDDDAKDMVLRKLSSGGKHIAEASLGGSAIYLNTDRPELLERLDLPALAYVGDKGDGKYRMPLLCAKPLLEQPAIATPPDVEKAIKNATRKSKPLIMGNDFPWTLYDFQSTDAGEGLKILTSTGGVLFAGDMGSGKMEHNNNRLWTPNGYLRIGDAQPGDEVYGTDGKPHTITAVYPQGKKQLYTVTFNDNTSVKVGAEHLWTTTTKTGKNPKTTNTTQLNPGNYIPIAEPLTNGNPGNPTLGFATGAFLAKGENAYRHGNTETMIRILLDMHNGGLTPEPYPTETTHQHIRNYVTQIVTTLTNPLLLPLNFRIATLNGAITAAGKWTPNGAELNNPDNPETLTTLTQTLGGTTHRNNTTLTIHLPHHIATQCGKPSTLRTPTPRRRITTITPAETAEATCITVNSPNHLYLTEHAITTHNTTVSLAVAHQLNLFPLLAVAPLSAFSTWERQLGEMGRTYYTATGNAKKNWEDIANNDYDAYIISYDRLATFDEILRTKHLQGIIADELQRIRNAGSRRSRAIRALSSAVPYRIGLSGTPFVNGIQDLLAEGAFLLPSDWPPRANTKQLNDMYPGDPIESVTDQLHSIMIRRRMDQVGKKLAKREDYRVFVNLTAEQSKAIRDLEEACKQAKEDGEFDGAKGKMNALVKLGQMRKITACPHSADVPGPNPKVNAAVRILKDFKAEGRKTVVFAEDRPSLIELCDAMSAEGLVWGRMWGASSAEERIQVEKDLHAGLLDVVACTTASSSESWTASPTATAVLFMSYQWQPSLASQAAARVYRLNSKVDGPAIKVVRLHAKDDANEGTVDDRMNEILGAKYELFSKVVDKTEYEDSANDVSYGDLIYMLTGSRDKVEDNLDNDAKRVATEKKRQREHAKNTIYKKKSKSAR